VVAAVGEVDVFTAPSLDEALSAAIGAGCGRLIVDLSGVDFLDSTGLSVLVKALKRIREADGSLDVIVSAERVAKVFRLTGLDKVIPLHASVQEARELHVQDQAADYDEPTGDS
jgi:anti-sigma B factor antagonist